MLRARMHAMTTTVVMARVQLPPAAYFRLTAALEELQWQNAASCLPRKEDNTPSPLLAALHRDVGADRAAQTLASKLDSRTSEQQRGAEQLRKDLFYNNDIDSFASNSQAQDAVPEALRLRVQASIGNSDNLFIGQDNVDQHDYAASNDSATRSTSRPDLIPAPIGDAGSSEVPTLLPSLASALFGSAGAQLVADARASSRAHAQVQGPAVEEDSLGNMSPLLRHTLPPAPSEPRLYSEEEPPLLVPARLSASTHHHAWRAPADIHTGVQAAIASIQDGPPHAQGRQRGRAPLPVWMPPVLELCYSALVGLPTHLHAASQSDQAGQHQDAVSSHLTFCSGHLAELGVPLSHCPSAALVCALVCEAGNGYLALDKAADGLDRQATVSNEAQGVYVAVDSAAAQSIRTFLRDYTSSVLRVKMSSRVEATQEGTEARVGVSLLALQAFLNPWLQAMNVLIGCITQSGQLLHGPVLLQSVYEQYRQREVHSLASTTRHGRTLGGLLALRPVDTPALLHSLLTCMCQPVLAYIASTLGLGKRGDIRWRGRSDGDAGLALPPFLEQSLGHSCAGISFSQSISTAASLLHLLQQQAPSLADVLCVDSSAARSLGHTGHHNDRAEGGMTGNDSKTAEILRVPDSITDSYMLGLGLDGLLGCSTAAILGWARSNPACVQDDLDALTMALPASTQQHPRLAHFSAEQDEKQRAVRSHQAAPVIDLAASGMGADLDGSAAGRTGTRSQVGRRRGSAQDSLAPVTSFASFGVSTAEEGLRVDPRRAARIAEIRESRASAARAEAEEVARRNAAKQAQWDSLRVQADEAAARKAADRARARSEDARYAQALRVSDASAASPLTGAASPAAHNRELYTAAREQILAKFGNQLVKLQESAVLRVGHDTGRSDGAVVTETNDVVLLALKALDSLGPAERNLAAALAQELNLSWDTSGVEASAASATLDPAMPAPEPSRAPARSSGPATTLNVFQVWPELQAALPEPVVRTFIRVTQAGVAGIGGRDSVAAVLGGHGLGSTALEVALDTEEDEAGFRPSIAVSSPPGGHTSRSSDADHRRGHVRVSQPPGGSSSPGGVSAQALLYPDPTEGVIRSPIDDRHVRVNQPAGGTSVVQQLLYEQAEAQSGKDRTTSSTQSLLPPGPLTLLPSPPTASGTGRKLHTTSLLPSAEHTSSRPSIVTSQPPGGSSTVQSLLYQQAQPAVSSSNATSGGLSTGEPEAGKGKGRVQASQSQRGATVASLLYGSATQVVQNSSSIRDEKDDTHVPDRTQEDVALAVDDDGLGELPSRNILRQYQRKQAAKRGKVQGYQPAVLPASPAPAVPPARLHPVSPPSSTSDGTGAMSRQGSAMAALLAPDDQGTSSLRTATSAAAGTGPAVGAVSAFLPSLRPKEGSIDGSAVARLLDHDQGLQQRLDTANSAEGALAVLSHALATGTTAVSTILTATSDSLDWPAGESGQGGRGEQHRRIIGSHLASNIAALLEGDDGEPVSGSTGVDGDAAARRSDHVLAAVMPALATVAGDSHMPDSHMPLTELVQLSLSSPLQRRCAQIESAAVAAVVLHARLYDHYEALRAWMLLGSGHVASQFIYTLRAKLLQKQTAEGALDPRFTAAVANTTLAEVQADFGLLQAHALYVRALRMRMQAELQAAGGGNLSPCRIRELSSEVMAGLSGFCAPIDPSVAFLQCFRYAPSGSSRSNGAGSGGGVEASGGAKHVLTALQAVYESSASPLEYERRAQKEMERRVLGGRMRARRAWGEVVSVERAEAAARAAVNLEHMTDQRAVPEADALLQVVFTPSCLARYARVHSFLLRVRWVGNALRDAWTSVMAWKRRHTPWRAKGWAVNSAEDALAGDMAIPMSVYLFRHEASHVLMCLDTYLTTTCLRAGYQRLLMETHGAMKAGRVQQLVDAHECYTQSLMRHAMLPEASGVHASGRQRAHELLLSLLDSIEAFSTLVHQCCSGSNGVDSQQAPSAFDATALHRFDRYRSSFQTALVSLKAGLRVAVSLSVSPSGGSGDPVQDLLTRLG